MAGVYREVKEAGNTLVVPHTQRTITMGNSSSRFTDFDEAEHNIYVEALSGCTSVIVVSRKGAWMSHLWEGPSFKFREYFQEDVLDYLRTNLSAYAAAFSDSPKAFIMTPAPEEYNLSNNNGQRTDVINGNNPQKWPVQVGEIRETLNEMLPGVAVDTFVYQVQEDDGARKFGSYGKAMVSTLCLDPKSRVQSRVDSTWRAETQ